MEEIKINGIYRHFKGKRYKVLNVARHSETQELMVVYMTLYGDYDLWVRPYDLFMGSKEVDGKTLKRFELET